MRTKDIAEALGARLDGDGAIEIGRLVHPAKAELPSDLALAISTDAAAALSRSKAQLAVISAANATPAGSFRALIAVKDARLALAQLTALFDPGPVREPGIHPTALIAADAVVGEGVSIGPHSVVGARSRIGGGTKIMPHVTIGADVTIGSKGLFHSGVRIGDRVTIGDRAIIHGNAVIGADGFSFAPDLNSPIRFAPGLVLTRVHSLGNVLIDDDVEIGACTCIDRSTLEATRIGRGTKIDNLCHIGHNVVIGESCILAAMVGIAGSVIIGNRVRIAGRVGIGNQVAVGDEAIIGAGSGLATNVEAGAFVSGYPAIPHGRQLEQILYTGRQKKLHQKVDALVERLEALERMNKQEIKG